MITLRLLGTLDLTGVDPDRARDVLTNKKAVALLVYLVIETPAGYHRRDRLVGLLWPELDQQGARAQLRKALSTVRAAVGSDVLLTRGDEEVSIAADAVACDALDVERAFEKGQYARVVELTKRNLADLLPGFFVPDAHEFEDWLSRRRAALRDLAAAAAWSRATQATDAGERTVATDHARYATLLAPTDEHRLRSVMELLAYRLHNNAAAVAVHEEFARRLRRDFDAEPSAETRALAARIRAGQ